MSRTARTIALILVFSSLWGGSFAIAADEAKQPVVVAGKVFLDTNNNGKLDPGERGLRGVRVSDGVVIVVSDRSGSYKLASVDPAVNRFVFVITPTGYAHNNSFYKEVAAGVAQMTADFPLTPSSASTKRTFSFAQITDTHVQGEYETLLEDLAEVAGLKVDFAIATGDLTNNGQEREQLQTYRDGIVKSPIPVINCPGNHDVHGSGKNYEDLLGPTYYSFDYGGCHFVMMNSIIDHKIPYAWLRLDLKAAGKTPVLFFQHYQPDGPIMRILSEASKPVAIFTGHWHSTKVFPYGDKKPILYVNSPTLRFGGIDASGRGFVFCHVNNGKLTLDHRLGGIKQHLAISVPGEKSAMDSAEAKVVASAYDSSCSSPKVTCSVDGGKPRAMTRVSDMSYSFDLKSLKPGSHTAAVKAEFAPGQVVEKQVHFEIASSAAAEPKPGKDWPTFHQNAARTGVAEDSVKPPLAFAWATPLGGTTQYTSPVVAGKTVYIGVSDENNGGHAGVYALDSASGQVKWFTPTKSSIKHTVTYYGGRIYTATIEGDVLALDADSGDRIWSYSLGGGVERWMYGAPVVRDGVVYAGCGPVFVALDARTGKLVWPGDDIGSDWISCPIMPTASPDHVFTGVNWSKGAFAIDRRTGKVVWNRKDGFGSMYATAAYDHGRYYNASGSNLWALDASTNKDIWQFTFDGGGAMSSPAVAGDRVVVGGPDGWIYCVDDVTGKQVWKTSTGPSIMFFLPYSRDAHPIISSPAISGDVVYCGSGDGKLYALDMNDGKVLWSYDCGLPITSSPAVAGNAVYVSAYDGTVYAFCSSNR